MGYWEATGETNEWYTPPEVFAALCTVFDVDVAPAQFGASYVPAANDVQGCGLAADWSGFVWMNPPFGGRNGIVPWLDKFIAHGNGIALTPDRTSAPWFQDAVQHMDAVLFTRKLKFLRPDGSRGRSPSNGTALMALGEQAVAALQRAAECRFGVLLSTPAAA